MARSRARRVRRPMPTPRARSVAGARYRLAQAFPIYRESVVLPMKQRVNRDMHRWLAHLRDRPGQLGFERAVLSKRDYNAYRKKYASIARQGIESLAVNHIGNAIVQFMDTVVPAWWQEHNHNMPRPPGESWKQAWHYQPSTPEERSIKHEFERQITDGVGNVLMNMVYKVEKPI